MLYAMVERCPVFGGKVKSFDASKTKVCPAFMMFSQLMPCRRCSFLGRRGGGRRVHLNAMQARKNCSIDWDLGPHADESSESLRDQFQAVDSPME